MKLHNFDEFINEYFEEIIDRSTIKQSTVLNVSKIKELLVSKLTVKPKDILIIDTPTLDVTNHSYLWGCVLLVNYTASTQTINNIKEAWDVTKMNPDGIVFPFVFKWYNERPYGWHSELSCNLFIACKSKDIQYNEMPKWRNKKNIETEEKLASYIASYLNNSSELLLQKTK